VNPLMHPVMQTLGRWSYGMFILHVPLFIILWRGMGVLGRDSELTLPIALLMLAVVLAASWPAHQFVEEPMRRWIRNSYDRARAKSAARAAARPH
jgi:peptidoglycan/LPS O-acetylase OafA/YrhL